MSELRPCPFCGDENLTVTHHEEHWVFCNSCFAAGGMCPSVKCAKEEWNTRAAPALPDGYRVEERGPGSDLDNSFDGDTYIIGGEALCSPNNEVIATWSIDGTPEGFVSVDFYCHEIKEFKDHTLALNAWLGKVEEQVSELKNQIREEAFSRKMEERFYD